MVYKPKQYEWRGFSYSVDPNVVGKIVEAVEKRDGLVTPLAFLEEARAENSPIHSMFTWDNNVAAERYRLQESRNIINCLTVKLITNDEVPKNYKAFVNVADKKNEGKYLNISDAFECEETRAVIFQRALNELESFANKYSRLEELKCVFDAIEKIRR